VLGDVLDTLDATAVRSWCKVGLERLRGHQREIDELNVYPVPDGDTGTNLVLTMTSAGEAVAAEPAEPDGRTTGLGVVLRCLARGALLGARGNSGVILSQIFGGIAETLAEVPAAGGRALAAAFDRAAESARHAVAAPVEGTILTVIRAAADAALAASADGDRDDLADVVRTAAEAARVALARTPEQLPALARAGVVDAGGRGLVVLLDALVEVVTGATPAEAEAPVAAATPPRRAAVDALREAGSDEFGYEVQYLLDAPDEAVERLRAVLASLGDSLVVVGARGPDPARRTWNVHVHVNDVGAALEAGVEAGRPHRISVTRFVDQMPAVAGAGGQAAVAGAGDQSAMGGAGGQPAVGGAGGQPAVAGIGDSAPQPAPPAEVIAAGLRSWAGDGDRPEPAVPRPRARAVVVVCDGDDMAGLFAAEGAEVVRRHPDGAAPSTGEILDAVRATGAGRVVILPNDANITAAAAAAAAEARSALIRAGVVPTRSPVQALAALAVRDPSRRFEDDTIAMAEAAGACRYAEVTTASREALTVAGRCRPGDVLALIQGEVSLIGADLLDTCERLLDRLLGAGGEMVTLLTGDQAPPWLADRLIDHVRRNWPFVEVHCYRGGQPHYPLLVGVE
jgi:DAK2 domain fusion protein YloV